jgi:hypothetical protein
LSGAGLRNFAFDKFEIATSLGNLDCLHFCHGKPTFVMKCGPAIGCRRFDGGYEEWA